MPKLDIRGQQSSAPAAQQVAGAYGQGIAAAMLKVSDGIGNVAKAGSDAIDFFDMLGESEARLAATEMESSAEEHLYKLETDVDPKTKTLKVLPEDREAAMETWLKTEQNKAGSKLRGSGARYWEQSSATMSAQYGLKARQSARSTALNQTRANLMQQGETLVRTAETTGKLNEGAWEEYTQQIQALVNQGALDADTATRLRLTTAKDIRNHEEDWRVADEGKNAARVYYESVIDGDLNLKDAMRQIEDNTGLDPAAKTLAKSLLARDVRLHEEEVRQKRDDAREAAYAEMYTSATFEVGDISHLDVQDQVRIEALATSLRTGKVERGQGLAAAIYIEMIAKQPGEFKDLDLWEIVTDGRISRTDFQFLTKAQNDMKSSEPDDAWKVTPAWQARNKIAQLSDEQSLKTAPQRAVMQARLQRMFTDYENVQRQSDSDYKLTPDDAEMLMDHFILSPEYALINHHFWFFNKDIALTEMTAADVQEALNDDSGRDGTFRRAVWEQMLERGEINQDVEFGDDKVTVRMQTLFKLAEGEPAND
jgi:hypothetical protein